MTDRRQMRPTALRWTKTSLNNWYRQVAGSIVDAPLVMKFYGFGGPEIREGVASHREKRAPDFRQFSHPRQDRSSSGP